MADELVTTQKKDRLGGRSRKEPEDKFGFRIEDTVIIFDIRHPIDRVDCIFVRLQGDGNKWHLVRDLPSCGLPSIWVDVLFCLIEVDEKMERMGAPPWIVRMKEMFEEAKKRPPREENEDEDGFNLLKVDWEFVGLEAEEPPDESEVTDKRSSKGWIYEPYLTDLLRRRLQDDDDEGFF